jgi:hypothetical protein
MAHNRPNHTVPRDNAAHEFHRGVSVELKLSAGPRAAAWDALWRRVFFDVQLEAAAPAADDSQEAA